MSAELRGDEQAWRALHALDDDDEGDWAEVMPAALVLAAARRFRNEDLRLVTVFVRKFLTRHPQSSFSASEVEAVLRGVLGEQLLFDSVDRATAGEIVYAMLFALIDELDLTDDQVDGLLAAAEKEVAAAHRAGNVPPEGPPGAAVESDIMHRRTRRPYLNGGEALPPRVEDTSKSTHKGLNPRPQRRGGVKTAQPSTSAGRLVIASMLRHSEERERWSAVLREHGAGEPTLLTRAAFTVAVRFHFRPDAHLRDISDLVAATQAAFYPELDLMASEFMVRAALGEDVPDPGLSVRDEILAKTLVLGAFADWWKRDELAIKAIIVQAEADVFEAGGSLLAADS